MEQLVFCPCLALRSSDTMETLEKQQNKYNNMSYANLGKQMKNNIIHPCVNLQKKNVGLSGFMIEISGDAGLKHLDSPTEEIFRGISVVKCNMTELESIALLKDKEALQRKLDQFARALIRKSKNKSTMVLEQVKCVIVPQYNQARPHTFLLIHSTCSLLSTPHPHTSKERPLCG